VEVLLENGANCALKNNTGMSPIDLASSSQISEIFKKYKPK
jgi:ankyrin repeat protein